MRILFFGDIVGRAARNEVVAQTAELKEKHRCDFVVTNCENAAGGFGVTADICNALFDAGNDVLTSGNHCLLYTSPSPRDLSTSRMPSSA